VNPPYTSPNAFRRALTDRLRVIARPHGPWSLPDLQRQFAYDRLLARLYLADDAWIIKGATALLARDIAVRHTIDIDMYRATTRNQAEQDLRHAARRDLGDWFQFETGQGTPVADAVQGLRVPVTAAIGTTSWAKFHVDIVAETVRMTGTPDDVTPLIPDIIPGLTRPHYRAYPLVDHIADKIAAILERHGNQHRPSARFKDLVDLVTLVTHARVSAAEQLRALHSELDRRRLVPPAQFEAPDRALWVPGYAAEARRAIRLPALTLDEALATIAPFVQPLLDGDAAGLWDPPKRSWSSADL
jgi:hypothetical protein